MFDLVEFALIAVTIVLNTIITLFFFKKLAAKLFPDATAAISSGMSALAAKSGDVRAEKALEKAVAGDILDQFPEIVMLLNQLSPETADMVRKNPQMALNLIQRYKPLIDKFLPMLIGEKEGAAPGQYDL